MEGYFTKFYKNEVRCKERRWVEYFRGLSYSTSGSRNVQPSGSAAVGLVTLDG
jgi:hypothetical protein